MSYEAFKTAEKQGWEARAAGYDAHTGQVTTRALPTLLSMAGCAPGMRLLDLCCGTGRGAGAASALGAEAEGLDIAPAMVAAARATFPGVAFDVGDAEAIPRADDAYDAVLCAFGVMHVGSTEALFREIARVLRPGGRVALSHWIGPEASPLFRIVFGALQEFADLSVVPPGPSPFALSTNDAMEAALVKAGFGEVAFTRIPLVFRAPEGQFAAQFRAFAARAAIILDAQSDEVLEKIHRAWDAALGAYLENGEFQVPMPALAVSAVRLG